MGVGKMEKVVCSDTKPPACADRSKAACSDGSGKDRPRCQAQWLCENKMRPVCSDGKYPQTHIVRDPKKQGWNRPVRRPKPKRESITLKVTDAVADAAVKQAEAVADRMVDVKRTINALKAKLETALRKAFGG